jgi:hypothetical protein
MVLMATTLPPMAVGGDMGILAAAATTVLILVVKDVKESIGGALNNRLPTGKIFPCPYLFLGAAITVL